MSTLKINRCPNCGSGAIRRVKRDVQSRRDGVNYTAKGVVVEECPDCGERLFGPEALRQIAELHPRGQQVGVQA